MKKIFFALVLVLAVSALNAQYVKDYLKAADKYYEKGDYSSAATYYEKYLNPEGSSEQGEFSPYTPQSVSSKKSAASGEELKAVAYKLAESYRMLNYPAKAEPNYAKVVDDRTNYPVALYHYAVMQRALGKYADAEKNFKTFLTQYKTNDEYRREADRELKNLAFIQQQLVRKDLKYFTLSKAGNNLNATGASYAPAWSSGNRLVFTSTRPLDSLSKEKKYMNRIYETVFSEGIPSPGGVTMMNIEQDDEHQGITTLTPDGNTIYLTRWKDKKEKEAEILMSTKGNDGWSEPKKLHDDINPDGTNSRDPFVTADGKYLIFSSNRSGGQGGYDLWYAELTNGIPGTPQNLGSAINTIYDEVAPFYHPASRSLIFSSNGYVGMGGFDFFSSKGYIGSFATPENLGYPVNSIKDDIYFTSRGGEKNMLEDVVLSSDRSSVCCLELFYLKKARPLKEISGRIVSCDPNKPITGGKISVIDTVNNKTIYTATVGADGSYSFTMPDHLPLKLDAEANGFIPRSMHVGLPADMEEIERAWPELCLNPVPEEGESFVIENVYFDFDKATLREESFPALDEVVRMMNYYPNMEIELSAHTDAKGSDAYNLRLSDARAKSVLDYLVSKGIDAARLQSRGYGESQPVAPNTNADGSDNPEGRQQNRRTEFKVLKKE